MAALEALIAGVKVRCEIVERDRHGRLVAKVFSPKRVDIGRRLVLAESWRSGGTRRTTSPPPLPGLDRGGDLGNYPGRWRLRVGEARPARQRGEELTVWRRRPPGAGVLVGSLAVSGFTPENAECIAPANPGGGWDFTGRQVGRLLSEHQLVPGTVQVTNMAGGVGAAAYSHVMSKRADDPNVIIATSTVGSPRSPRTATRPTSTPCAGTPCSARTPGSSW